MSRKFHVLRKNHHIKKAVLAKKIGVDVRTITNWEKTNGIVPSLDKMASIASAFQLSLFEIYSCFMSDPDVVQSDDVQDHMFIGNEKPLVQSEDWNLDGINLFIIIYQHSLKGLGTVNYQYCTFRFSHVISNLFDAECPDEELMSIFLQTTLGKKLKEEKNEIDPFILSLVRAKNFRGVLSDGCIIMDGHFNTIVLNLGNIYRWRMVAQSYGNVVFEIEVKKAIFPEMETDITNNQISTILLTFFDYGDKNPPRLAEPKTEIYALEKSKVLGRYLKEYRKRHGLDQRRLAEYLSRYSAAVDNKRISKLENGEIPSADVFRQLCTVLNLPEEKLLDAFYYNYFDSTDLDTTNQIYKMGLSLRFFNTTDFLSLSEFLQEYVWAKQTMHRGASGHVFFNNHVLSLREDRFIISEIDIKEDTIYLYNKNNKRIALKPMLIKDLRPYSSHANCCYEFRCSLIFENVEYDCILRFYYYMAHLV